MASPTDAPATATSPQGTKLVTAVTTLVRRPDDMVALTRNIDTATDLVDHAIVALRKKYPAPK